MVKVSGNTRMVKPYHSDISDNIVDFDNRIATGLYDLRYSHLSSSGTYVAYMKGHSFHLEEIEAADALSNAGFNVVLTPEGDGFEIYATNFIKGRYKYSEGTVSQLTYEQRTPDHIEKSVEITVRNAIKHANTKKSQIALIYDRYSLFHRDDIENGMKLYQQSDKLWAKKVKAVLIVNAKGEVYEHQFE